MLYALNREPSQPSGLGYDRVSHYIELPSKKLSHFDYYLLVVPDPPRGISRIDRRTSPLDHPIILDTAMIRNNQHTISST